MSQSKPIEMIADSGDAYAFGLSEVSGPGDVVTQESVQGWTNWLQERFSFKFVEQGQTWESLLRQTGDRVPAQVPGMTFRRVARLINDGTLQVRQRPRPAPSANQKKPAEGEPASEMRSQTATGSGGGAAAADGSSSEPQGATHEDTGPATDEMQCKGDPVSPVTGEEILILDDFSVAAPMPFHWRRRYRSRQTDRDLGLGAGSRSTPDRVPLTVKGRDRLAGGRRSSPGAQAG